MHYLLDEDGQPYEITVDHAVDGWEDHLVYWAHQMKSQRQEWSLRTKIGVYVVSTVFLGLDHSFMPGGPPVLFETMIFKEAEVREERWGAHQFDDFQTRYCTWADAQAGHQSTVAMARKALSPRPWWRQTWGTMWRALVETVLCLPAGSLVRKDDESEC